jgi:hypothetical protein
MDKYNQIDKDRAENHAANETSSSATTDAILAMVSYLQSETELHNPIAAYFLAMCRLSLLQSKTDMARLSREK